MNLNCNIIKMHVQKFVQKKFARFQNIEGRTFPGNHEFNYLTTAITETIDPFTFPNYPRTSIRDKIQ